MPILDIPELDGVAAASVASLRARGVSEKRLRVKSLARPFRGVRAEGVAADLAGRAAQYAPRLRAGQLISGAAAAALLGLPLPDDGREQPVTIVVAKGKHRPSTAGIESISLVPERIVAWRVHGIPVTSPILTWCVLARSLDVDALIMIADALMAPRDRYPRLAFQRPAATRELLLRAVEDWRGSPGADRLRSALEEAREGVDPPMETPLRCTLVRAGLPEPEINGEIWVDGVLVAQPDLVFRDRKVAVEFDGSQHWDDPRQRDHDLGRDERLRALGWTVIRVTARMMADPAAVVARVRRALAAA